jgi:hypothetical protein
VLPTTEREQVHGGLGMRRRSLPLSNERARRILIGSGALSSVEVLHAYSHTQPR